IYYILGNEEVLFDHVYIKNFNITEDYLAATNFISPMVGSLESFGGEYHFRNCGVTDTTIKNSTTSFNNIGGLFAYQYNGGDKTKTKKSTIENCFVRNFDVELSRYCGRIGSLCGNINQIKSVENCYASGNIRVNNNEQCNGLIGQTVRDLQLKNVYVDVNVERIVTENQRSVSGVADNITKMENVLSVGDLKNKILLKDKPPLRIGLVVSKSNVYAADFQRLNGKIEPDNKSDANGLLSYEELILEDTYRNKIQMGDSFDYSYVKDGYLPILKDTDGKVMPYQGKGPILFERRFEKDVYLSDIEVNEVTETSGGTIQATLKGLPYDAQTKIKSVKFKNDELTAKDMKIGSSPSGETIMTMDTELRKAYDSYYITEVVYEYKGQEYTLNCYEEVMMRLYHNIDSVERWKQLNNKKDYENYMITKDLDFENVSSADIGHAHNINRLVGQDIDGRKPVIKNIDLQLEGENLGTDDAGLIKNLLVEMSNLKFENCSLYVERAPSTSTNPNYRDVGQSIGFIVYSYGIIKDIELDGIYINQSKDENNLQVIGSKTGFISSLIGILENTEAKNMNVTGYNFVGSMVGNSNVNGVIRNCQLSDSKVQGTYYVGGIGGQAHYDNVHQNFLKLENVTVESIKYSKKINPNYFGGVFGQGGVKYATLNNIKVNVEEVNYISLDNVYFVGGVTGGYSPVTYTEISNLEINAPNSSRVGGIVGDYGYSTIEYNHISDAKIIGRTYVGGVSGYKYHNSTTNIKGNILNNVEVKATNGIAGGIIGYSPLAVAVTGNTIRDVTVTAEGLGTTKGIAGGIVGQAIQDTHQAGYVNIGGNIGNVEVSGSDIAGGIVGQLYANANINGTGDYMIFRNIIKGNIRATNANGYAGGIVGERISGKGFELGSHPKSNLTSNILSGTINGANASPTIGNETTIEHFYNTMVHNSTRVNGSGVMDVGDVVKSVDKETLMEHNTYLNANDPYTNSKYPVAYWKLQKDGQTDGHFPQQKTNVQNVYIGYGDGVNTNSGIYFQNILDGISFEIPENNPAPIMKFGDDLATMPE
ncbi:MAG: hypothetical protein K2P09_08860, partial [Erysipelotrichales bacterium]|nr:hypothetical protein [Erysipelotrichales bacterium]